MQRVLSFQMTPYFAFGQNEKTSLIAQFCRQNNYQHFKNPILESIKQPFTRHTIIQGSIDLFKSLQPIHSQLRVLFIGAKFSDQQIAIRNDYKKIGKYVEFVGNNYEDFRKSMFPNIIFIYGPFQQQNESICINLSQSIDYVSVKLPKNSNIFIREFKKTVNYVVNGFFTSLQQLSILQKYFNIKIVHLHFSRVDWPQQKQFFDKQFEMVPHLKQKPYYKKIKGDIQAKMISQIKKSLCPQLIYLVLDNVQKRNYVDKYVSKTKSLVLSILQIQSINKRKNISFTKSKQFTLNSIIFKDLSIKQVFMMDYPYTFQEVFDFQSVYATKFSKFVDLVDVKNNSHSKIYTAQMYFLQNQKRICPRIDVPLEFQISNTAKYWVLNGPPGSGKTTIAKILNSEYNLKHIEFQPYLASVKQKLMGPEDGEQLPLKKIFSHFKSLINSDIQTIYVIDGLPYQNKDWAAWIQLVGQPSIINIGCGEVDSIKRTRKKNQGDVNAQITQQQLVKAKQNFSKVHKNIQIAKQLIASIQVLQLSFVGPLILAQNKIHQLFRKRIFVVRNKQSETEHLNLFYNIAIKNNIDLINLNYIPLRQCLPLLRKCKTKDVILFRYQQQNEKLVSQDLYWIQKNLGDIKYLAVWDDQEKIMQQKMLELQRPVKQEKPKVQGEGQQKPAQQGQKPATFDIYSHQWTESVNHPNMSQWFFKCKKNIKQSISSPKECYKNFGDFLNQIKSSNTQIYQKILQ